MHYERETRDRKCLRCQKAFVSKSWSNRLCGDCRKSSVWRNGESSLATTGNYWVSHSTANLSEENLD